MMNRGKYVVILVNVALYDGGKEPKEIVNTWKDSEVEPEFFNPEDPGTLTTRPKIEKNIREEGRRLLVSKQCCSMLYMVLVAWYDKKGGEQINQTDWRDMLHYQE